MANTKTAKKMIKVHERRRQRNQRVKSQVKTAIKKALQSVQESTGDATDEARAAMSMLDRAVAKGIVHKNRAARKKSRLFKKLNPTG
ncbi:MAG: 30S ribosomal protein S20 [Armatimonadetes bacterium]|nr:30S ribosomal protein S20 [Armatimonadota bacterium]